MDCLFGQEDSFDFSFPEQEQKQSNLASLSSPALSSGYGSAEEGNVQHNFRSVHSNQIGQMSPNLNTMTHVDVEYGLNDLKNGSLTDVDLMDTLWDPFGDISHISTMDVDSSDQLASVLSRKDEDNRHLNGFTAPSGSTSLPYKTLATFSNSGVSSRPNILTQKRVPTAGMVTTSSATKKIVPTAIAIAELSSLLAPTASAENGTKKISGFQKHMIDSYDPLGLNDDMTLGHDESVLIGSGEQLIGHQSSATPCTPNAVSYSKSMTNSTTTISSNSKSQIHRSASSAALRTNSSGHRGSISKTLKQGDGAAQKVPSAMFLPLSHPLLSDHRYTTKQLHVRNSSGNGDRSVRRVSSTKNVHDLENNNKAPRTSSILEAFLRSTQHIDPNKGSDAALATDGISQLYIKDGKRHSSSEQDGSVTLLQKLLTGEIDQSAVGQSSDQVTSSVSAVEEEMSIPLTEEFNLDFTLDPGGTLLVDELDRLLSEGIDDSMIVTSDLDEILQEQSRQDDLWLQHYIDG